MLFFASSRQSILISSQSPAASRWCLAAAQQHAITAGATIRAPSRIVRSSVFSSSTTTNARRALSAATATSSHQAAARRTAFVAVMGVVAMTIDYNNHTNTGVLSVGALPSHSSSRCDSSSQTTRKTTTTTTTDCDAINVGKITTEPITKILFPALVNGMSLAGVGVRVKYMFVNVYAVGAYFDPIAMMAIKQGTTNDIETALVDPTYPRTIRIVMNRGLSVDKFINAIVEAVEPRLKGKNLDTLDEFKELFPKVDLTEGDEVEMTIRGDVLLLKTGLGVGTIRSRPFTEAMCDVYFGKDAVSPTLKNDVLKGIPNL